MKRVITYMLLPVLVIVCALPVSASSVSSIQSEMNSIDSKIDSLEEEKEQAEAEKNSLNEAVENTENEIEDEQEALNDLNAKVEYIRSKLEEATKDLEDAESRYNEKTELLKKRLVAMYVNRNDSYIDTLMESDSADVYFEKVQYMNIIAKSDKELVNSLKAAKDDINLKKEKLAEKEKTVQEYADYQQDKLYELRTSRAALEEDMREVNQRLEEIERDEDELNRQSAELAAQLRNLSSRSYSGGSMMWPTPSSRYISSYYGYRIHPILGYKKFHSGLDIGASYGSSIVAANSGTVHFAGWQGGYGNTVIIDHGGNIATLYAHCSSILVGAGQSVKAGQVIAKVGSTGLSTGPHLHFEVREGGNTTDPLGYVRP